MPGLEFAEHTFMRASVRSAAPTSSAGVLPSARRTPIQNVRSSAKRVPLTLAGAGFVVYLWVIHSAKAPIGAAAIAVGLIGLALQHQKLRVPAPLLWFGAFLLWAAIGLLTANFRDLTKQAIWEYLKIWLIFLLALNIARDRLQFRWMMIAWLGIFALYPVRGTLLNIASGISTQNRYAWNFIFSNPNDLATLCMPILGMSAAMLQTADKRWVRYSSLAGIILIPIIIIATQSRGGALALATFGAMVLLEYRKRIGVILLAAFTLLAIIQIAPPDVWGRLGGIAKVTNQETIGEADRWGSAEQRYDIWGVAKAIIADHPVTGIGLGAYAEVHTRYAATGKYKGYVTGKRDAHSTYLTPAAETGYPGLALFLVMIASTFVAGWKAVRRWKRDLPKESLAMKTLLFGLIAFLQAAVFGTMNHLPFLYIYIAVIFTMIAVNTPEISRVPARIARNRQA